MKEMFRQYTFVLCCVFLFPACEKDNASGCNSARSTYLGTIEEYVAATRAGNFRESRRLLDRLTALSNNLDRVDANETVSAIEEAFRSLPLEAGDSSGDWELYRGSCKMAELMADAIWRLTNSPDRVIDFICLQRQRYEGIARDSERRYRELMRRQNGDTLARQELVRLHNLKCNYIHSITIEDESTLFSVISNKFFPQVGTNSTPAWTDLKKHLDETWGWTNSCDCFIQMIHRPINVGTNH